MAKAKTYNIFDSEYVESLKDSYEIDGDIYYSHDILKSLGSSLSDYRVSLGVWSDEEKEDAKEETVIGILKTEYTNQPFNTWVESQKKELDTYVKELKKAFDDITGGTITFKKKEELFQTNRDYIKSAMGTERMHIEQAYAYTIK